MTRWLSKLIARLFVKLFAVAFTQLEASLDLVLIETQQELLDEAERSEARSGIAAAPAVQQLRAAAQRLSLIPHAIAEEPELAVQAVKPVTKSISKAKAVPSASQKRVRGRPRKAEPTPEASPASSLAPSER